MSGVRAPDLIQHLSRECDSAGGQSAWARRHGFSAQYVCDLLRGHREPTEAVANALGYLRKVVFIPIKETAQ